MVKTDIIGRMARKRDKILLALLRFNAALPLLFNHALGVIIGTLVTVFPNRRLSTCRTNIGRCFPSLSGRERNRLVRSAMRHTGRGLAEAGRMWLRPVEDNLALIRSVEGEGHIRQALDSGRGVILATPHLGNWELFGLYCSSRYPMTNMYREPPMKGLDETIRGGRESGGGRYVPADASGVRAQLKALKQGEMVGMLPDQVPSEGGLTVPFFGLPAVTMTLLSQLARKSGAAVIFGFAERLPWARGYRIHFLPPDELVTTADIETSVTRVNAQVEQCIRMRPDQYLWIYKRFRNTDTEFYDK